MSLVVQNILGRCNLARAKFADPALNDFLIDAWGQHQSSFRLSVCPYAGWQSKPIAGRALGRLLRELYDRYCLIDFK